jgi:hypothetical protein
MPSERTAAPPPVSIRRAKQLRQSMIPKNPAPDAIQDAIRGGYRFSEKIMLQL